MTLKWQPSDRSHHIKFPSWNDQLVLKCGSSTPLKWSCFTQLQCLTQATIFYYLCSQTWASQANHSPGLPFSYLSGWLFIVSWLGHCFHRFTTGVPKDLVLGAHIFPMYTVFLSTVICFHGFSYHCYAHDAKLSVTDLTWWRHHQSQHLCPFPS